MSRLVRFVPIAGITAYMAVGKFWQFDTSIMRTVTLIIIAADAVAIYSPKLRGQASPIDKGMLGFTILAALAAWVWPESAGKIMGKYPAAVLYVVLFIVAAGPPLVGREVFTMFFARKTTPEAVWETDVFVKINHHLTVLWAVLFLISAFLAFVPGFLNLRTPIYEIIFEGFLPAALMLGLGFPLNKRYPEYYQRKLGLVPVGQEAPTGERSAGPNKKIQEQPTSSEKREASQQSVEHLTERKESHMKVLALNSSPRGGGQSKTELMLDHLLEGMREAGADVEVVSLREKTVKNCIGCFTCWTKTPGVCIHKDDMTKELFPKLLECDLVICATPLYHFTVTAGMKAFIERTLPIMEPFFDQREGKTRHPRRHKFPAVVVLSVAGFPEDSVFDQLSSYAKFLFGEGLVAEIYRPAAETMTASFCSEKAKDILDATRQAGHEIVESMKVSEETLARIKQPIVEDYRSFREIGNLMWKTCIREGVTPKEFGEKGLIPRPDSIKTFMMIMPMGFNPKAAGDTKAVMQFKFSGEVEGSCHLKIENGEIEAIEGTVDSPDLNIESPFEVWMDIITGKVDGQQAFMAQKYKVMGDLSLLMKMNELFGG